MKNKIIKGTIILSAAGILTRLIGFYYRIFLAGTIGATGLGLYQMIFPVYGLCISFAVTGIEISISKYVAFYTAEHAPQKSLGILKSGLSISLYLSILTSIVLYLASPFLATHFIGDQRCEVLLQLAAYAIPFCAIHGCIIGYFLGKSQASIPAIAQLSEQVIRVLTVYLISIFAFNQGHLSPKAAMAGLFSGEVASSLVCLIALISEKRKAKPEKYNYNHQIFSMAIPLSLSRVFTSLILSSEAVLILRGLKSYGLSHDYAVSLYGVLTGMAMPFIFFPSTITGAISSMILPSISEAQSAGNYHQIAKTTTTVVQYCFSIGIFFAALFYFTGDFIGIFLFQNADAGTYISLLAWLCPFMYLGSTLSSVLNGLGLTKITSVINITVALTRIAMIFLFVPTYGIKGYLWGLLLNQILSAFLLLFFVKKYTHFKYRISQCIVIPCIISFCSIFPGILLFKFLMLKSGSSLLSLGCSIILSCGIFCLFLFKQKRMETIFSNIFS
ncbi:MAG: polysaccharide biosynthesis protein [Lachnospiraceae bacterium]|nr:polysaccharide biosynthesis protein [Lachnospiraceae bacterium]